MTQAILTVNNLSIATAKQTLVQSLSFELQAGKTLAIVGESGSGKSISTLALLGLLPKNLNITGKAVLDGVDLPIGKNDKSAERIFNGVRGSSLGMVFQEPMTALNPLHKVGKQLGESLSLIGVTKSAQKAKMIELLQQVQLNDETLLHRYPHELSGGQRQRVMIAMALAQNPKVLVADEPTTALDVSLRHGILQLLNDLKKQHGMGLILISHDLNLVKTYSDDVVVMKAGQVIETGTTKDIFDKPQDDYTKSLIFQDFGEPLPVNDDKKILSVQSLNVNYPQQTDWLGRVRSWFCALNPLDFGLNAGQSIGIVGESGSGKTTLALALTRLITHHAKVTGQAWLCERDILSMDSTTLKSLRKDVQMVFQDPFASLNPRFTIYDIIREGLIVQGVSDGEQLQKVREILGVVGLNDDYLYRYPHELSGGQRQRVALARALILRPKLIVLDEPTSALDSNTQVAMVALLRQIQADFGVSYILISHDLSVVRALCQYIMVLKGGQCIEQGDSHMLFDNPAHDYTKALMGRL